MIGTLLMHTLAHCCCSCYCCSFWNNILFPASLLYANAILPDTFLIGTYKVVC